MFLINDRLVSCLLFFTILLLYSKQAKSGSFNHEYQEHQLHHHMTKRELQKFFEVSFHDDVPQYYIAQSYENPHNDDDVNTRHKRNTDQQTQKSYTLKGFGTTMNLNLQHSNDVISPNMVVRTYHEDGSTTERDASHIHLYNGHVTGHPGSRVSVLDRDGLTGVIDLEGNQYLIRPLPSRLAKAHGYEGDGKPHVVYRRSATLTALTSTLNSEGLKPNTSHKVLEMTLVADPLLIDFHGNETVEQLLLVAHLARGLFLDESIGPIKVNLVINGIVLNNDGFGYTSETSASKKLHIFSDWCNKNINPDDTHPEHPDTAILITRSIGGIAIQPSTCVYSVGKAVVGHTGLVAAATKVVHETAHTFDIDHDIQLGCPNYQYIMSTLIGAGKASHKWSSCSRDAMQNFLSGPRSACLDDEPQKFHLQTLTSQYTNKLPGEVKNRDAQCKIIYGDKYSKCMHGKEKYSCKSLYCGTGTATCYSLLAPPADGSECGPRHWCIKGECLDNRKPYIDGGWSPWSNYSSCSRTCGGGIQWKTRTCTNPRPSNDGKPCPGKPKGEWEICNTQECPQGSIHYRLSQCKALNPKFNNFRRYSDPCTLGCMEGSLFWNRGKVKDGTRCTDNHGDDNVCIYGTCTRVGCDGIVYSSAKRDRCHVCNGNSSSCAKVTGVFTDPCKGWGFNDVCLVLNVKAGSWAIKVEKTHDDCYSYLGIQDQTERYLTKYMPSYSATITFGGTRIFYYREPDDCKDRVYIPGQTTQPIRIVNLPVYYKPNQGIAYSFFIDGTITEVQTGDFEWKASPWSSCSKTCGKGQQSREVECVRKDDGTHVNDKACETTVVKPAVSQVCNAQACPPRWHTNLWKPCTVTCGGGKQTREIVCRQEVADGVYDMVADSMCTDTKPTSEVNTTCNIFACPAEWITTEWSECSATCEGGFKIRTVMCKRVSSKGEKISLHASLCIHLPRPSTKRPCNANITCYVPITERPVTEPPQKRYIPLGCFKDSQPKAISDLVVNLRGNIDWYNINKTIDACADYVHTNFPQNKVFAIQFYGECWTGATADQTYSRYGKSSKCARGVGLKNTFHAYHFRETEPNYIPLYN